MLAKLTSRNQITIPKDVLSRIPDTKYFEVEYQEGVVVLKPVQVYDANLETIRAKVKKLGLSDSCVAEAVKWVRSK
jgi:hypothetical protein